MPAAQNEKVWSWFAVLCRVVVGGTFVVAATLKLITPIENFEAAVRAFHLVPSALTLPVAFTLPWIELFAGAFCLLGLYTRISSWVVLVLLIGFVAGLTWVKLKGLDLETCGCFGRWDFVTTPGGLLIRDAVLVVLTLPLLRRQQHRLSLEELTRARS